jgi:hypothetical protein
MDTTEIKRMPVVCSCLFDMESNITECQFHATLLNSMSSRNLSPSLGGMYKYDAEVYVFLTEKNFILLELHHTSTQC